MATHDVDPADTAMAVLIQPLIDRVPVAASARRPMGDALDATWGLGSSIAQGEVTPDRYELQADGAVRRSSPDARTIAWDARTSPSRWRRSSQRLDDHTVSRRTQAAELGRMLRRDADCMGMAVEIEWASTSGLQAGASASDAHAPGDQADKTWLHHPRLNGHPAGVGWGEAAPRRQLRMRARTRRAG